MTFVALGLEAVERGLVPDAITRAAIRRLCRGRLRELAERDESSVTHQAFLESMREGPIAPLPERANDQHYEVPEEFFGLVLGPRRKYSCCEWADGDSLANAELRALDTTARRARLDDGQQVLELGCGWGSFSLWAAQRYAHGRFTAVSNSASQRRYIEAVARERGLSNLAVVTADMNDFTIDAGRFDRVVSIEMFEHMRNYGRLLERIAKWLKPDGKLFVHWFCHRSATYPFENEGDDDWMARHFFSGGIMPSESLLRNFAGHLRVAEQWRWSGLHYRRTAEAWLANLDAKQAAAREVLERVYGGQDARRRLNRWRIFFLAVAELFAFGGGDEWFVSHQLLEPVGTSS